MNIYLVIGIEYNYKRVLMKEFKPIKQEKIVISIRLGVDLLTTVDDLALRTDISRNEFIVQCIDYALKNFKR